MAILSGKEIVRPFIRRASGYIKSLLSAEHVEMANGATLQQAINETNTKLVNVMKMEEGSNSNGRYIKWPSGILEQWIDENITMSISNPYGVLFQGTHNWTYPILFKETPFFVVCSKCQWDTGASWGTVYSFSNAVATIRAFDIVSRSAVTNVTRVTIYARGRWK